MPSARLCGLRPACAQPAALHHNALLTLLALICVQSATDYGPYVQNLPSPLHTTTLVEACTQLLVDQWLYLRANVRTGPADCVQLLCCLFLLSVPSCRLVAVGLDYTMQADKNMGKFLDYCTYGHMIDNVILIVTGTLHERDVQVDPWPTAHTVLVSHWSLARRLSALGHSTTATSCNTLLCRSCWQSATRWACLTPSRHWRLRPTCGSCTA